MIRTKTILIGAVMLAANMFVASDVEAGPLLDWLRGRRAANNVQQPAYNYYGAQYQAAPVAGQYTGAHNPAGLQPGQCMRTCQKTCTRTVVNYVPYTAYRTSWKRVPVTTYRPVTNQDPCTGCTVTCMRPCTTYTYQMQRVPYTTQRPVYRTETYRVPVTTITNDCANGACNSCNTCGTGYQGAPIQGFAPATPTPAVEGSSVGSSFDTPPAPADIAPSIRSGSQSSLRAPGGLLTTNARYKTISRTAQRAQSAAPRQASASPVQRNWNYSPVRLASFNKPARAERAPVRSVQSTRSRQVNSFWNDVK